MLIGYNTNGFAHHRLSDTFEILEEIGYGSIAVTLEPEILCRPDRQGVPRAVEFLQPLVRAAGLRVTIETGSRFILDPRRKHHPTLVSSAEVDRGRRIEFLKAAIDIAEAVAADSVSLWSGATDDEAGEAMLFDRLCAGLGELLDHAGAHGIRLSFEPEPGMFVDTMSRFARLVERVDHPLLGLTLDVGHVHCLGDGTVTEHVRRWRDRLWNIHIEDMRPGVHEHLMFGDGDLDFDAVFQALRDVTYAGPIHVELSRHSHNAVEAAKQAYSFLHRHVQ